MGYSKHNLYWGRYEPDGTNLQLNEGRWEVMKYRGSFWSDPQDKHIGHFANASNMDGQICLILDDHTHQFWPVISFLTKDEAVELVKELSKFISK